MTLTRRTGALLALALALVLAACSQPADLGTPTLETQFGSEHDDIGSDVVIYNGRVSVLSKEKSHHYDYYYDDGYEYIEEYKYEYLDLSSYDASGNFVSSTRIHGSGCNFSYDECPDNLVEPKGLYVDSKGVRYVLYSVEDQYDDGPYVYYYIAKRDALGNGSTYSLGRGYSYDPAGSMISAAVDGSGNLYVAKVEYSNNSSTGSNTYTNVVAKYSTTGALQWQRTSTVGTPYGITVSSSGSVYVVGTTGLARYTNSGGLTWSKAASNSKGILTDAGNIVISGSSIYTRSGKDIRRYDGNGKQLWLRTQSGLNTIVLKDVTGDSGGSIYISGKYQASTGNTDAFVRKLNSSGSTLWTKTFGTTVYDEARDAATVSGSEIYVTGETQGSLAHQNLGGENNRDAYIRKLNSSGNPIWTR